MKHGNRTASSKKALQKGKTLSLREKKKRETKEKLLKVSLKLFQKNGFESTTIEQIAEKTNISKRTFFRYFQTKEELLFPKQKEKLELFTRSLQQASSVDFFKMEEAFFQLVPFFEEEKESLLLQQHIIEASDKLKNMEFAMGLDWENAIVHYFLRSEKYDLFASEIMASSIMGAVRRTFQHWLQTEGDYSLEEYGKRMMKYLRDGFLQQEEKEISN